MAALASLLGFCDAKFNMCQFGADYKEPARIWTNDAGLWKLGRLCCGIHAHIPVAGNERYLGDDGWLHWRSRAAAARQYPNQLSQEWGELLSLRALPTASGRGQCFLGNWKTELLGLVQNSDPKRDQNRASKYIESHTVYFGQNRVPKVIPEVVP